MLPAVAIAALQAYVVDVCGADRVEVEVLGVATSALARADALAWDGDPCHRRPTLRLQLVRDGVQTGQLTVRPTLDGTRRGPVASVDLDKDAVVQWTMGSVPLGTVSVASAEGLTTRPIAAGTPLTPGLLRPAPDSPEGTAVTVVVRRGGLALTVPGTLLRDGVVGQPVRVRNDTHRTALTGVLVAADRVEIR